MLFPRFNVLCIKSYSNQMTMIRYLYIVVHKKVNFLGLYPLLLRKIIFSIVIVLVGIIIFLSYSDSVFRYSSVDRLHYHYRPDVKYLINTSNCQIPDVDAFNEDVLPYVKLEVKEECTSKPLLTYIEKSIDVKLKVNKSVIYLYSTLPMSCCYSKVFRQGDDKIFYSQCKNFDKETKIDYGIIRVTCSNIFRIVYENVHATFISPTSQTKRNTNATKPHKIFLLGIDSISRLNLQRSMPKTFRYLEKNFEPLLGYNKIGDNTFPNLMAILTGRSSDTLGESCQKNETFDNCDFIWNAFKEQGFVTAYGEDEPEIGTFNYWKQGFAETPTDYYLRPYFISAYHLAVKTKYSMTVCSGNENTGNRMLNAVKDFELSLSGVPSFALFFMNSFSHDNINLPSSMDQTIFDFLADTEMVEAFRDSTVIIFSDHGFRFGDIRFTYTGWMEERLPFIYFKLPEKFRHNYPNLYENFAFNARQRLSTPYDFHMTLKHLLHLFNDSLKIEPAVGCSNARSLFEQIPENRSCADACIPEPWCTCKGYNYISIKENVVSSVAHFLIAQVNEIIKAYSDEAYLCAQFQLHQIILVGRAKRVGTEGRTDVFWMIIKTSPYAMFEATVQHNLVNNSFNLLGDVSRLNSYRCDTTCITKNGGLKKYCVCKGWMARLKSAFCS